MIKTNLLMYGVDTPARRFEQVLGIDATSLLELQDDYSEYIEYCLMESYDIEGEMALKFLDFFLRVTIPFACELKNDDTQGDTQTDSINQAVDPITDPIKLLKFTEADPNLSYKEYAEKLGVSPATIKRRINDLKAAGRIIYIGAKKNGHWKIIDKDISEVTT